MYGPDPAHNDCTFLKRSETIMKRCNPNSRVNLKAGGTFEIRITREQNFGQTLNRSEIKYETESEMQRVAHLLLVFVEMPRRALHHRESSGVA